MTVHVDWHVFDTGSSGLVRAATRCAEPIGTAAVESPMSDRRGNIVFEGNPRQRYSARWQGDDPAVCELGFGDTPIDARDALLARSGPDYKPARPAILADGETIDIPMEEFTR